MDLEQLRQTLLATARANRPEDHVPYAFEKRVMAHLEMKPAMELGALWARALWRAAAPCVAVSLVLLGISFFVSADATLVSDEGSPDLEETMLAVIDQSEETW